MFHGILTLSTTAAVMLHALLGCCAHHSHACDTHRRGVATVADESDHGHCHHNHEERAKSDERSGDHGGHDHHGHDGPCSEPDCSFVIAERCDDVTSVLSLLSSLPVANDAAAVTTLRGPLRQQAGAEVPSGHLFSPEPLRAQTQVWRL